MGSICLSSASILRCDSLTRNQNIYLIIPTALEVIFSTSLIFIDRGPGKRNLLLTAEGLIFLILAVLELLSQILPAVRGDFHLFKAFDLAIGIASFLPISFYTLFLYLLTNADIISAFPRRIKNIVKLALIPFMLTIIIFNEIASFIGVSVRNILAGQPPQSVVAIGFSSSNQQGLWTFFTSLTLALLTGFQAAVFGFAFFRLTQAILDQRRIEIRGNYLKAHPIKGIGWICGSLKLGAIETVIGFAGGGFGVVLTRRILRLLVRISLCIGVAKGVDLVEDFRAIRNEPSGTKFRRSQIHGFISNPRSSTFHQLSPKATTFHAAQQVSDVDEKPSTYRTLTSAGLPGMAYFANIRAKKGRNRVTVRYEQGTPSLHVRFSMLDIPSPVTMVEPRPHSDGDADHLSLPQLSFKSPFSKSAFRDSADSVPSFSEPFELVAAPRRMLSQRSARAQLYRATSPVTAGESQHPDPTIGLEPQDVGRVQSMRSIPDSLQAVQDLAGQFPGPPLAFKDQNTLITPSEWEVPIEAPMPQALGSPSELQFKEQPPHKGDIASPDDSAWTGNTSSFIAVSDHRSMRSSRQPTLYTVGTPLKTVPLYSGKSIDPFNDDDEEDVISPFGTITVDKKMSDATVPGSGQINSLQDPEAGTGNLATALDTGKSRRSQSRKPRSLRQESLDRANEKVAEWIGSRSRSTSRLPQAATATEVHSHDRDMSIDHLAIPWLKSPDMEEDRLLRAMSKSNTPISRVKSVGKAPRKSTPLPIHDSPQRGSTHLKPIIIPPRAANMPEILDEHEYGSLESTEFGGLRDSGVLGDDN